MMNLLSRAMCACLVVGLLPGACDNPTTTAEADIMPTITYVERGRYREVSDDREALLVEALDDCLGSVSDRLRLLLDQERVAAVLAEDDAWSFEFQPAVVRDLGSFGRTALHRVVIPLSGELAVDGGSLRLTLLTELGPGQWMAWLCRVDASNPLRSPL